ncbi:hypothetical protein PMAYCL1PPCAC_09871 [Pristionchus mayeri]|uniref:Uncharacterized protein n=1 Tax=Pristionchus mayeri TaxID=1317129 RepID=A0AAN4ZF79_9BILA|nr:hypothetical protein PMAYCL1PPCAC_09871 [Pristionchus mayeri]
MNRVKLNLSECNIGINIATFSVNSLECVVCMENSLDEFGECGSQFRFDCASYASNFGMNEKIFCRTTRKRELNNTYTIAKECISERDHHRTFVKKDYPLEDECDLLEVDGTEIAYCLCRGERCNQKPIAEQFMSFEEKHPELFGDLDEEIPSTSFETEAAPKRVEFDSRQSSVHQSRLSPILPLSKASAVKKPNLSPIMPINDPRSIINDNSLRRTQPSFEISKDVVDEGKERSVLPSRGLDASLNIHKITVGNGKLPNKETELSPWSSARSLAEGPVPSSPIAVASLRCMQCGEGGLADSVTDCLLQASVSCKHEQSFCFTRHILIASGQNAIEKMCVSQEALIAEYGQSLDLSKREIQCTSISGGRMRVCVCGDEDNCNQRNVEEQLALSPASRNSVVKAASATLSQPVVPIDLGSELASSHAVAINGIASSSAAISPDSKPIVPVGAEPTPATTTTRSVKIPTGLHCSVCSSGDLSDPTADCPTVTRMACMALPGERSYCLTRQTQLSNGLFTMEKTCMTGIEFSDDFPDEKSAPGCGTAFDGLVNYCLCTADMCNQDSLLSQAAENIPDASARNHRSTTTTTRPLINQMKLHEEEPVQIAMEEDLEQPSIEPVPSHKISEIPDLNTRLIEPVEEEAPEPTEEDKAKIQKMLREQQWKDDTERLTEKSVNSMASLATIILVLTIFLVQ